MLTLSNNVFALDLYKPPNVTSLKNIYILHDPDQSGASFYLVVHVGEADMAGPDGLAHYLEHLSLFSAQEKDRGETTINVDENAFAYRLATVFYVHADAQKQTEAILKRLAGLFQPIKLDRKFMSEERKIVEREFQIRAQNFPLLQDHDDVITALFAGQNLGRSVLGNAQTIQALSIDDALATHDEFYYPGNASLYVIGDVNSSTIAKLASTTFPPLDVIQKSPKRHFELDEIRVQDEVQHPEIFRDRVIFKKAIKIPPQYNWAERTVLRDHLHEMLSSSYPSGLRKSLQFDAFWAADLVIELEFASSDILLLEIDAAPDSGVELEDLALELERQLALIAQNGVARKTFYDLKNKTEFFYADLKNSPVDLHEYVYRSLIAGAEPPEGEMLNKAAKKLTHSDIDAMMQAIVAPTNTSIRYIRAKQ